MKHSSFIIFFSIVLIIYGLVNYYIFITGWNAVYPAYKTIYLISFLILSLSYLAGRFSERAYPNPVSTLLIWIGSFWMAAMVYFLIAVLLLDLSRLINLIVPIFPGSLFRNFEQSKFILFIIINSIVFVTVLLGFLNARSPRIKNLNLNINKKAGEIKQLTIAVASDIHLGTIICKSRLEKIVKIINSLDADIVLLPGDVVDEDIGPVIKQNQGETIRKIESKYGVYAITGNHEYIGGVEPACKYLVEHGIIELRDNHVKIEDSLYIIGREDRSKRNRKPLNELMNGIDRNLPLILMDHQPVHLEEAEKNGIDLQLSGHTHHGQLWPFNFITKKIYELSRDYKKKSNTHYYVSCGVGTWGPPVRTGNRPEIIKLILNFM